MGVISYWVFVSLVSGPLASYQVRKTLVGGSEARTKILSGASFWQHQHLALQKAFSGFQILLLEF